MHNLPRIIWHQIKEPNSRLTSFRLISLPNVNFFFKVKWQRRYYRNYKTHFKSQNISKETFYKSKKEEFVENVRGSSSNSNTRIKALHVTSFMLSHKLAGNGLVFTVGWLPQGRNSLWYNYHRAPRCALCCIHRRSHTHSPDGLVSADISSVCYNIFDK